MIDIFERKQIGDGIWFNRITDKRFKVNLVSVGFYTEFDELSRSDYAAVPYILTDCCAKYPDYKSLSARCYELYDASLSDKTDFGGRRRYTSLSVSYVDDIYALEGEKIEKESAELLAECIFRPLTENGCFNAELTRQMKGELIDAIDSIINDKRSYAAQRAARTAFRGEPVGEPIQGSHEQAERVTPESAWEAYRRMLERGHVEIFAAGKSDFAESERILTEEFSRIKRHDVCELLTKPSVLKPKPEFVNDTMPMQQAVIRMYFKAPDMDDRYANVLFGMILGGMTTSRFFSNIREKQSLCYYCSCFTHRGMRTLTAYAGVEPQNIERTRDAILKEFDDIRENGVTEEELERAKLEIINEASSTYDSVSAISGWYLSQLNDGEFITPEEYIERIKAVTPERVRAISGKYTLDTVYTLCGEERQ